VVVDAALRDAHGRLRLSGRAIGVADGFQLCAARGECTPEGLLTTGDQLARDIAEALTAELDAPALTGTPGAQAIERYLVGKHLLRTGWSSLAVARALPLLEEAHRLAPDHPGILAAYSMARSRAAFFGLADGGGLAVARELAERAVACAPELGEPWLALGTARLYDGAAADAAHALLHAVKRAPGLAEAQTRLGEILLEAGDLAGGIAHLEAAIAIDPAALQPRFSLSRAYELSGQHAAADAMVETLVSDEPSWRFNAVSCRVRYRGWRGQTTEIPEALVTDMIQPFRKLLAVISRIYGTRAVSPEDLAILQTEVSNPRRRSAVCQFVAEALIFAGVHDAGLETLAKGVDAGLGDLAWLDRCPLFNELRAEPNFASLRAVVAGRAERVLAAVEEALSALRRAT
jgi:eukaryotic-like serine/threonine-protein kinase